MSIEKHHQLIVTEKTSTNICKKKKVLVDVS